MSESPQGDDNQFGWFLLAAWATGGVLVFLLVVGDEGCEAFTPFLLVRVLLGGIFFIPATAVLVFLVLAMSKGGN